MARDYAAEIAAELKRDKIDWNKLSQLTGETGGKIGASGQSTESYINQLYAQRTPNTPSNPYGGKTQAVQTAYVDPNVGNMSIVGGEGNKTTYQQKRHDEYLSQGYVPIVDQNIISQLQQGVNNASKLENTQQWQDWFAQNAGSVTPLSQAEIDAATQRLAAYDAYKAGVDNTPTRVANSAQGYSNQLDTNTFSSTGGSSGISGGSGTNNMIQELVDAQKRQQIAALDKAKSNSLTNLADEEAGIDPAYYDERNRVGARKDVGDLNFAQYMASRGIQGSAGGANQMYSNSAFQGQIGALDRQEQAARDRIARNRTGIENAYQSDVAAAKAGTEAQGLQAFINQMNADRMFDLQKAGVTGEYQGRPTMQGQQNQAEQLQQQASLLAAQYYDNIAGYINTLDPNDPIIPYLHVKRREKINTEAEKVAFAAATQSEEEQTLWDNAFKLFQQTGGITSPEQAQILGLPPDATVADVDIARINAATSQMNAQTARTNAKTAANKTEINDVPIKVKDYYNRIIDMKDAKLKDADGVERRRYDDISIRDYVLGLPLNDDEIAYLLSAAGISNIIGPAQYGQ